MTDEQQNIWWRKYNSFRLKKAEQYRPAVYKALQQQLNHFATYRNIDTIPMQPIADVIKSIYVNAGRLWAAESYRNVLQQAGLKKGFPPIITMPIKARAPFGYNEDFINALLQYFELKLLNDAVIPITETTKDFIRQSISDGLANQLSLDEIIQQILQSGITKTRAELISRTEVMKAAAVGEQIGVDKTGLQTNKIWISVRDKRTRHDHINADNQVVPDGKPFDVAGYLMQRPGDSSSEDGRKVPAKEICNCRCTIGRKVLRGGDGLPLRK